MTIDSKEVREARVVVEARMLRSMADTLEAHPGDSTVIHEVGMELHEVMSRLFRARYEIDEARFNAQDRAWATRRETKGASIP
jgi:hypothetical protein